MTDDTSTAIKTRSFDHRGRIYDVTASSASTTPYSFCIDVTCNGRAVNYDYPDGYRTTQRHEITLQKPVNHRTAESMNAVDYSMDEAEALVRRWVA
jgi:hypothetical protein